MPGYDRSREDWEDFPSTATIIRQLDLDHWEDALYELKRLVFNVRDYGAVGNGTADDTVAIQAAIDAATTAGGGIVFFPAGTYKIVKLLSANYALAVYGNNITFQGVGGASVLRTSSGTGNGMGFYCFGGGKVAGMTNWSSHTYYTNDSPATRYTISPASRSAVTVTTVTASDAGAFAAGDYVYIRTGQCIDSSPGTTEPDSEINQVVGADAGTGIITVRWPLVKPYAQEYYVTGTSGRTSTSVTANLAPLAITKVTDRTMLNLVFRDFAIEDSMPEGFAAGGQIVGLRFENITGTFRSSVLNMGDYRKGWCRGCVLHGTGRGATVGYAAFSAAKGTTDVVFAENYLSAEGTAYIHFAEGNSGIKVSHNTLHSGPNTSLARPLGLNNRAYDVSITDNTVINAGNDGAIAVGTYSDGGGVIAHNIIRGTNIGSPIIVGEPNWQVGPNYFDPALVTGLIQYGAPKMPQEARYLTGWVRFDRQNPTLGVLAGRYYITNVRIYVEQAFDSSGTDTISVGDDTSNVRFATTTDVSTTGNKTVTLNTSSLSFQSTTRTIEAYYVAGGGAPTTGKALVIVEYILVPENQ